MSGLDECRGQADAERSSTREGYARAGTRSRGGASDQRPGRSDLKKVTNGSVRGPLPRAWREESAHLYGD